MSFIENNTAPAIENIDMRDEPLVQWGVRESEISAMLNDLRSFALNSTYGNIQDAEDLIQDTFLRAVEHSNSFIEGTNFRGWIYTIFRNTAISRSRTTTNRASVMERVYTSSQEDEFNLLGSDYFSGNNHSLSAEETFFFHEETEKPIFQALPSQLQEALAESVSYGNNQDTKLVILLMVIDGFKYKEIANLLKIPIGTVMSTISRSKERLTGLVGKYLQEKEN